MDESIRLVRAIDARLNDEKAVILDLSRERALIEHAFRLSRDQYQLSFEWEGEPHALHGNVVSTTFQDALSDREQRLIYHTTLEFTGERASLERAFGAYEHRLVEAQEANSAGVVSERQESIDDVGRPVRDRSVGYVSCIFRDGKWRRSETRSRDQPLYGFTVAAHESEEHLRLLQLAYEEADAEGRRLLREFAAASVSAPEPPAIE